ncbi:tRNA (N6-threonylcarbamoyladenosine(37)-N6)-methyltransferase TrmO [Pseudonocardia sp. CNS-139]|nr:tRNA (N6-threonylcarbamoyladenosine(37)-N6)-methyltransferase TrmO [Pseudonocardia sp. CNS-139]
MREAAFGLRPVGYVRTPYREPAQTPIQTLRNPDAAGRVEVFPEFAGGLAGLAGFTHVWLLSWLDRAPAMPADGRVVPFLLRHTGQRVGVFATRHPARPNPIALSVVRVEAVDATGVDFRGVDLLHGTPVLDLKPWEQGLDIPGYDQGWDAVRGLRGGWYQDAPVRPDQVLPD